MRRTIPLTSTLLAVLLALGLSATARAASPDEIIDDCSTSVTGYLTGTYTKGDLRRAAKHVRGDIAEYTGCFDAIRQALSARTSSNSGSGDSSDGGSDGAGDDLGGGIGGSDETGGGSTGDGSTDPVDEDDEVVVAGGAPDVAAPPTPQPGSDRPVNLAGATIRPGTIPSIGRESNELPSAMIVLLVLLGVGALGSVALTIGRRVLARRSP